MDTLFIVVLHYLTLVVCDVRTIYKRIYAVHKLFYDELRTLPNATHAYGLKQVDLTPLTSGWGISPQPNT